MIRKKNDYPNDFKVISKTLNMFTLTKALKKIVTHSNLSKFFIVFLSCFLGVSCVQKNLPTTNIKLLQIEDKLLQRQNKSAKILLDDININTLNTNDKMLWYLYDHVYNVRKNGAAYVDTNNVIIPYFEKKGLYRYAGHALIYKGKLLTLQQHEEEAMLCFKKAENYLLQSINISDYLLADLYYQMAICYKADGLIQEGDIYAQKAIQHGKQAPDYLLVSESYKIMGNTHIRTKEFDTIVQQEVINLYDSAIHYHYLNPRKKIGDYHNIAYNKALFLDDTIRKVLHGKYLVDSLHVLPPASAVANYYFNHNKLDSAWYYIQKLATDTNSTRYNTRRMKDAYDTLYAKYLQAIGNTEESSKRFAELAERFWERADMTERSRTYMIAQKYDVEKERAQRLELEVEKQNLWITLLITIGGTTILLLLFFIYQERMRRKNAQLEAQNIQQEQQIIALNNELALKRETLRQKLLQQIEFTRQMHLHQMRQGENEKENNIPSWLQNYINKQLLGNDKKGKTLCQEFNAIYHNMLKVLQTEYPEFTQADSMMCVFILLDFSITDICILLGIPKRTIWNRRNRIKEHLGLNQQADLDEWLKRYALKLAIAQAKKE